MIDAPDKLFVGKGMLHCSLPDKELIFNIVYKDGEGYGYIKRCRIDKFILSRTYELVPQGATLIKLTTGESGTVTLDYKPKPRVRILEEAFKNRRLPDQGSAGRRNSSGLERIEELQDRLAAANNSTNSGDGCARWRPSPFLCHLHSADLQRERTMTDVQMNWDLTSYFPEFDGP